MKVKFLVIFFFYTLNSFGQNERHLKEFFKNNLNFDYCEAKLKSHEFKISEIEKDLKKKSFFEFLKLETGKDENFELIGTCDVKFIDLNGDKVADIIFTNFIGIPKIEIYYGAKDSFKKVSNLTDMYLSTIIELKFSEEKCTEIIFYQVDDNIEDGTISESTFNLINDSIELKRKITSQKKTLQPLSFLVKPFLVRTLTDFSTSVENPNLFKEKNLSEVNIFFSDFDEIIGIYKKYKFGFCWGEYRDKNANLWYLVEMAAKDEIFDSPFEYKLLDKDLDKHYQIGWMEAKYLEKVK